MPRKSKRLPSWSYVGVVIVGVVVMNWSSFWSDGWPVGILGWLAIIMLIVVVMFMAVAVLIPSSWYDGRRDG